MIRDSVIWDAARDAGDRVRTASEVGRSAWGAWRSSGISIPLSPVTGLKLGRDLLVHGPSPAIGWAPGAARHPHALAVLDEFGVRLTYEHAEAMTRGATGALVGHGLAPGTAAAVLGRNSAGFAIAIAAVSRTGADLVYLNPGFTPSQLADIIEARDVRLVLVDPELRDRLPAGLATLSLPGTTEWAEPGSFERSKGGGRHIILTSGTTGRPKGADRSRTPLEAGVSLLAALPYRERATHVMASPMFHSWGWLNHRINSLLDSTEIMIARPTARRVLDAAAEHRADVIVTTPVVVRRLAEAGPGDRDLSQLRGVLVSGAPIPPDVITSFQEQFGRVIYNLYGSTEVGFATVAAPDDLAAAPTTAGRPLPGVTVQVLDAAGNQVPTGMEGEVWVGSSASFDGYVDGQDKDRRGRLVATGDLGLFDESGLLFVKGRTDDLIISGGENVHPTEVEAVLRRMPGIADVVAVGKPDPDYGQRVVVHVVPTEEANREALADDVHAFAREHLAGYQRPRDVIIAEDLPRNDTGKVLRRLL